MPEPTANDSLPLRLAVLISGGGRTMVNLQEAIDAGELDASIGVVVSSRADVSGIERAGSLGLPVHTVARKAFDSAEAFSDEVWQIVRSSEADLVCLAGFLSLLKIPEDYTGRVLNIHPALLPNYGGKGMYGHHVHEAVIAAGDRESGCTVHVCDNEYDRGPILLQRRCPVEPDDTADTLAARVFEQECVAFPEAIRLWQRQHTS